MESITVCSCSLTSAEIISAISVMVYIVSSNILSVVYNSRVLSAASWESPPMELYASIHLTVQSIFYCIMDSVKLLICVEKMFLWHLAKRAAACNRKKTSEKLYITSSNGLNSI